MLFTSIDLGLRERRLEGVKYISILDELMEALHARWPKAIIQFEDFQFKWAFETLQRYRKKYCMFNDDIQVSTYLSCSVFIPERIKCHFRPLRFDQFCDFRLKVCFSASGSKRFEILPFSSSSLTPSIFYVKSEGTVGVALAGLLGVVRAQSQPLSNFVNQKIVVVGAGSAGFGVLNMAYQAVSRMTGSTASLQFYLIDKDVRFYICITITTF
ncbi:putative malate dehydrogenase (decarboxylating) [Helianthus anomalus]